MELRVCGKYRIGNKLGSGAFGEIYLGTLSLNVIKNRNQYKKLRRSGNKTGIST
jgi:hypothetical protein